MDDAALQPVSRERFFVAIGNRNVHPRIVSAWPYRSEWWLLDNSRKLIGVTQEYLRRPEYPNGLTETIYYLAP
jgi:hypothetical protein